MGHQQGCNLLRRQIQRVLMCELVLFVTTAKQCTMFYRYCWQHDVDRHRFYNVLTLLLRVYRVGIVPVSFNMFQCRHCNVWDIDLTSYIDLHSWPLILFISFISLLILAMLYNVKSTLCLHHLHILLFVTSFPS